MPIEKKPQHPLPNDYVPPHSKPYPVKDTDTWETVAAQFHLGAKALVKFNFHTNNTDEVNWYLRNYVGCWVPSPSGNNWTFQRARKGVIYIPIQVYTFDSEDLQGSAGVEEDPEDPEETFAHHGIHLLHRILDAIEWGGIAAEIFAIGEGSLIATGIIVFGAPLAGLAASFMAVGLGTMDALDGIKIEQGYWGLSYGIVLGADDRPGSFVKAHGFTKHPAGSWTYPEQEGNFHKAYIQFLAIGLAYGRKMNAKQRMAFRKKLRSHMDMTKYGHDFDETSWPSAALEAYYRDAAIAFRRYILQM